MDVLCPAPMLVWVLIGALRPDGVPNPRGLLRLSPSNTHLAPIINAESEAIVNHGPSKHFSMLQRAATKAGAARPVWEGWLTKQGAVRRNWKRRWCTCHTCHTAAERSLTHPYDSSRFPLNR